MKSPAFKAIPVWSPSSLSGIYLKQAATCFLTSVLQPHSYTVVTKALHTSKIKQPYMILSKKVSCYDLPENISVSSLPLFCPAIHCIFTSPAIPQGTKAEHSFQDANILLLIFWSPQKEKPRDILFFCFSTTSSGITGAHVGSSQEEVPDPHDTSFSAASGRCETWFWSSLNF